MSILETSSIDTGRAATGTVISCPSSPRLNAALLYDLFIPFALQPIITMHVTLITMHVTAITCTVLILGIHGLNPAYGPTYLYGITRSSPESTYFASQAPHFPHILDPRCMCLCMSEGKESKEFL